MANNLAEQLVMEIQRNSVDLNRLQFGEVAMKVQNGKLVLMDIKKSIKPKD